MEYLNLLRKQSIKKAYNLFVAYLGYVLSNIFKRPFLFGKPPFLSIEVTNYCNLSCLQCPTGLGKLNRTSGNMSFKLYQNILNENYKHLSYLNLYFQGESFLHPEIFKMIEYASRLKVYTAIATNGHFLNETNCRKIIESGLNKIIISLDGATEESYKKYRRNGNFNKVIYGIEYLVRLKKITKFKMPFIELQFLAFDHNINEVTLIKKLGKQLNVDKTEIKTAQIIDNNNDVKTPKESYYSRYQKTETGKLQIKKMKKRCWRLWSNPVITWDGNILPCCFDKQGEFVFGNITNEKLSEIIRNEKSLQFREVYLLNNKNNLICNNCV